MTRVLLISISIITAGCWARPDLPLADLGSVDWNTVEANTEEASFERLRSLDRSTFDEAWAALGRLEYSQVRSMSVRDHEGSVVGRATQTLHFSGPSERRTVRIEASDSSGTFEESLWSRFYSQGSNIADEGPQREWPELVLPADPLFLSLQGPSYFHYAQAADTTVAGTRVSVLETVIRPESSRQGIQWARLFLHESSLVGVEVVFAQRSLLYHELSRFLVLHAPVSSGEWLPHTVVLESSVGLPFARTRSYEMHVTYSDISPQ